VVIPRQFKTISFQALCVPAIVLVVGAQGLAAVYLSIEEAQQAIFPGETFTVVELNKKPKIWRASQGGFFIIDKVIGKHEWITYALGINPDGSIRQIEIMEYREAYGFEVCQKKWRKQFIGKTNTAALKLNADIKNISGATLSCRHVTDGVKDLMELYETVLKK